MGNPRRILTLLSVVLLATAASGGAGPAAGASFYEAARLANYAGGLVVMKRGTATVSSRELADAVSSDHDTTTEHWSQEGPPQGRRTES